MKWNVKRDAISAVVGVAFGGGLIGTAVKKLLREDASAGTRFLAGAAVGVFTLGTGLIPFWIATPGRASRAEVAAARQNIAEGRY
jgi:ABC-type thiamin/hydroxymethylpyrimidine transport system permease subunit